VNDKGKEKDNKDKDKKKEEDSKPQVGGERARAPSRTRKFTQFFTSKVSSRIIWWQSGSGGRGEKR
jgi:hypothetical protein